MAIEINFINLKEAITLANTFGRQGRVLPVRVVSSVVGQPVWRGGSLVG